MKKYPRYALAVFASLALTGLALTDMASASTSNESARAAAGLLKIDIMAQCQDGNAVFRIKNVGNAWPKTSTFAIYNMRKKGKKRLRKLISKRRMRLKDGQRASFKIKTGRLPSGRVGLWVKPDWYQRDFDYDATITCSRPQDPPSAGS